MLSKKISGSRSIDFPPRAWYNRVMEQTIIDEAIAYVKEAFAGDHSGHDYFHTMRVYNTATQIAEQEHADVTVVQLAALLHDVDDVKLSPETHAGKERAVAFLKGHGVSEETIGRICTMIGEVSFRGTDSVVPETMEGKCVQDADRLDAIGAIGIARAFAYGGSHHRIMHDPDEKPALEMNEREYRTHVSTTVNHFYEKLFKLSALMNTDTAKRIAEERERYMRDFLAEFYDEWDGNK